MARCLQRWDRRGELALLRSDDPSVPLRFPFLSPAELDASIQLVDGEGTRQGAEAVRGVLALLPGGRVPAALLGLPVVRSLAQLGYRAFARHRHLFGCGCEACRRLRS